MDARQRNKQSTLILFGILIISVVWAAILAAPFVSGGLLEIIAGISSVQDPFDITWCADTPKTILVFMLLYGMGVGVYYATRRNYRKGEEHGYSAC